MTPLANLASIIAAVAPHAEADQWATALSTPMASSGITTIQRIAMFVAQLSVESGQFEHSVEDLYYLTAEHIREVWPSHFATDGEAGPFIGRPAALANRVYANRMGNGNEDSGDGWRYRGRGLIQLTGKSLYAMFAKSESRAADPDWLMTPAGAAESACWYWTLPHPGQMSLNVLSDISDVQSVTQRINGGLTALAAREDAFEAAIRAFGAPSTPVATADDLNAQELQQITAPAGSPVTPE